MKRILLIMFLSIYVISFAQTGINTSNVTTNSALQVDTPTSNKGVLIPRLTEMQRDAIVPTNEEDGLMIYNIDEGCINYWNEGKKLWESVCGGIKKANFSFDCLTDVTIAGDYTTPVELNEGNTISIQVNVSRPGDYVLEARTMNGYGFYVQGSFLNVGKQTIVLKGQGKPNAVNIDEIIFYRNGEEYVCAPNRTIEVTGNNANLDITPHCNTSELFGKYKVGVPLDSSNFIDLTVVVNSIGDWAISSNSVDGISFNAIGTFTTTGVKKIRLQGVGTPTSSNSKTMIINVVSNKTPSTCTKVVNLVASKKTMLAVGLQNVFGYTFATFGPIKPDSYKFIYSPLNFGTQENSKVQFEGWENIIQGKDLGLASDSEFKNWLGLNGSIPVDIVVLAFDVHISTSKANMLSQYLQNGGVVIAYSNTANDLSSNNLLQAVFKDNSIITQPSGGPGTVYPFKNINNSLLLGPFGDVRGKYWGEDASVTSSIPAGKLNNVQILSEDSQGRTLIFKHNTLKFIWIGDGGFNSSDPLTIPGSIVCPFKVNSQGYPVARLKYGATFTDVFNAVFTGNVFAWAIEQADK